MVALPVALPLAGCARLWTLRLPVQRGAVVVPAVELTRLASASDALKVRLDPGGSPLWVRRTTHGFIVLSGLCTHRGCELVADPRGFDCPCHGSRFDRTGGVLAAPAVDALPRLQTRVVDDDLVIEVGA